MSSLDPLTGIDWALHWWDLVQTRAAERGEALAEDYWAHRAPTYHRFDTDQSDPFLDALTTHLSPRKTLIDVGAGTGRHCTPLSDQLDWVTAVEPSEAMRERIAPRDNLTVIAASWEDADVAPADLVISCYVLHMVPDPVPWIQKMEAAATERVFICLRDLPQRRVTDRLWELMMGAPRVRRPQLGDLYNLLRSIGIRADLTMFTFTVVQRFESLETALEDARYELGERVWNESLGRAWLAENLVPQMDGSLVYDVGEMVSGIVHWQPRP